MDLKKQLVDNVVSKAITKKLASNFDKKHGGFILAYHQIDIELFKQQLEILKPNQVVSLDELVERKKKNLPTSNLFALTVDDCYKSTLPSLCDFCAAQQIPITFFTPIEFLDGKPMPSSILKNIIEHIKGTSLSIQGKEINFSKVEEINKLQNRLHQAIYYAKESSYADELIDIIKQLTMQKIATEADFFKHDEPVNWEFIATKSKNELLSFQSHSITHQPVTALNESELTFECIESKRRLAEITNKEIKHFCYPYGGLKNIGFGAQKIIAAHYNSAVTMIRGRLNASNDMFMLPRIPLYNVDSPGRTLLKVVTK